MDFLSLVNRVKYTLGAEEIVGNDEVSLIKELLNEGVVQLITRTRPYTREIALQLTANTAVHDMSNQILSLLDLEDPNYGFLKPYTREDVVRLQHTGGRGFAFEEPLLWVSPIPTEDYLIRAYGIFRPTPMAGDTDDPANPTFGGLAPEFHPAIAIYALWKMGEYVQHEGSGQGEKWRIQYEGQDSTEGQVAWIKRVLAKRVTPKGRRRRDLEGLPRLSRSGSYIGVNGG